MKKIIYAALLMPLLLFIGCNEDDKAPEPIITLGQAEVIFSNANQEKAVSVTVDTGHKFVATWSNEGAIWGEVVASEDGSGVTIYVSENSSKDSRNGLVQITTVGDIASKLISVHQNGINSTLDILPETLLFNQLAASKIFEVTTDADQWSVSGQTDWLSISMDRVTFNEAIVTVTENVLFSDRVATLTITAAGNKKEIVITQTAAIDIILPFLDFSKFSAEGGKAADSIKKFELDRGSRFIIEGARGAFTYRTLSQHFPEITYSVGPDLYQVIFEPSSWDILRDPRFINLLLENGFEYIYTSDNEYAYYWREYDKVECIIDQDLMIQVIFLNGRTKPIDPAQTESYPTFEEMPTGLFDWSSTKSEIEAWETAAGSTLKTQFPLTQGYDQFLYTTSNNNPRKEFERAYWIFAETNQYVQTMLMYEDITLAYFLNIHNEYVMTREFKKWLVDNEFEKVQGIGSVQYLNKATNIRLLPDVVGYVKNTGDEPVITLLLTFMKGDYRP